MAIKISGTTVIGDTGDIDNAGITTATSIDITPSVLNFNPTDGSTGVSVDTNIVITYSVPVSKGSGNIKLRDGSASGTVLETIAVSSGNVTISGSVVTINPSSNLDFSTDTYVVIDAGAFTISGGSKSTALLNTYNFTTVGLNLGDAFEGGFLICCSSNNYWIVAPSSSEVARNWHQRGDANTRAQQVSGCSGWFVPTESQLKNPGYTCRTYWDSYGNPAKSYWSDSRHSSSDAYFLNFNNGVRYSTPKTSGYCVRSFRCVAY